MVSYAQALEKIISIAPSLNNEFLAHLDEALGLVCASDIICQKNLPAFNNAAMDGYAFNFSEKTNSLKVKSTIFAGDIPKPILKPNECYKIMTGAIIPDDADTIAPFEDAIQNDSEHISVSETIKYQNAYRFKGEESACGDILIPKGTLLEPSHIMLLASQGITQITACNKPKIAIISTGDELREPWENCDENNIYNCNAFGIKAVLKKFGFKSDYCGALPDNLEHSISFFKKLKSHYEVIISSGGISMGEADFVKEALKKNGFKEEFHGVNLKPGRPTMAGVMENTLVISLPGNPMAAFLNTYLFAIPALKSYAGYKHPKHSTFKATNQTAFPLKPNRTNIILGHYENGNFTVTMENKFGSGMITPITASNAISLSLESCLGYEKNEMIEFIPL